MPFFPNLFSVFSGGLGLRSRGLEPKARDLNVGCESRQSICPKRRSLQRQTFAVPTWFTGLFALGIITGIWFSALPSSAWDGVAEHGVAEHGVWVSQVADSIRTNDAIVETAPTIAEAPVRVVLGGEELLRVQVGVGAFSPQDRADAVTQRLVAIAADASIKPTDIQVREAAQTTNVVNAANGDRILITVTDADARAADQPRQLLANNYRDSVRQGVEQYRQERQPEYLRQGLIKTAWTTGLFVLGLLAIRYIYPRIIGRIRRVRQRYIQSLRINNFELIAADRLTQMLLVVTKIIQALLYGIAIYLYVPLVLSFFPWTKALGRSVLNRVHDALAGLWAGFVDYLPQLLSILFILVVTFYLLKFLRQVFKALGDRTLTIQGFYPDWAQPTFRLLAILIIALAAVIAFPYLPGFGSPAFQGISIFLGVLFSLGSTAVVSNIVGGIILVYTRAFQIGDRVRIGDAAGDIVSKTLLVTRIRTVKNVVITLPNATVLNAEITNYSAAQMDPGEPPLILHTTVTLGYDVPWRKVHEVLLNAAQATAHCLDDPEPFVLQKSLDDFYVSYELNLATDRPARMARTYSELHQHIQDLCNAADIEILSPHYSAIRDGNQSTMPADYLGDDYQVPSFRVQRVEGDRD